ncbi:putative uncharacterized protein [Dialister sp. CAG:486]|nr:putative uncharacterized protein [Dialister sp. CAG:486]
MNKIELLAPAGTMEKMKMALLYGADAVYLAGKVFGLRAYGGNFTKEEMKEAVQYAHGMGKKVYVTVNIIPRNEDLEGLDDYLRYLEEIHVDAALISDLGVFSLAREVAPTLPIFPCPARWPQLFRSMYPRRRAQRTGGRSRSGRRWGQSAWCLPVKYP